MSSEVSLLKYVISVTLSLIDYWSLSILFYSLSLLCGSQFLYTALGRAGVGGFTRWL